MLSDSRKLKKVLVLLLYLFPEKISQEWRAFVSGTYTNRNTIFTVFAGHFLNFGAVAFEISTWLQKSTSDINKASYYEEESVLSGIKVNWYNIWSKKVAGKS